MRTMLVILLGAIAGAPPAAAGTLASSTLMGKEGATELVRCSVTHLAKKPLVR